MIMLSCCGKITFVTEEDAEAELAQMDDSPQRREIRVYRCRYGGYHLTSHEYNDPRPDPAPGTLILQAGRVFTCPWCGRGPLVVAHGRLVPRHRDRATLSVCTGSDQRVKYDVHGDIVKEVDE